MQEEYRITSSCSGEFFVDLPFALNFTITNSNSISLQPVPLQDIVDIPISTIPKTLAEAAKTAGYIGSIASISTANIVQANRISAISKLLTCDSESKFYAEPLDWNISPTQLAVGDGLLKYINGGAIGNMLIFGGVFAIHASIAKYFSSATSIFPSWLILGDLFFTAPNLQISTTMVRFGNIAEKVGGGILLLAQASKLAFLTKFLWKDFAAEIKSVEITSSNHEKSLISKEWHSLPSNPDFVPKYRYLFQDYKQKSYGFMVPEQIMTMTTGVLGAFQDEIDCGIALYMSTVIHGVYAGSIIFMRPHLNGFDKVFYGSIAVAEFTSLFLGSIQKAFPSLRNNTVLKTTAEVIPVALQFITAAKSIYDIVKEAKNFYKAYQSTHKNHVLSDDSNDEISQKLVEFSIDTEGVNDLTLEKESLSSSYDHVLPKNPLPETSLPNLDIVLANDDFSQNSGSTSINLEYTHAELKIEENRNPFSQLLEQVPDSPEQSLLENFRVNGEIVEFEEI